MSAFLLWTIQNSDARAPVQKKEDEEEEEEEGKGTLFTVALKSTPITICRRVSHQSRFVDMYSTQARWLKVKMTAPLPLSTLAAPARQAAP